MRGQMLWFNEAKDYGFIMTDDGERLAVAGDGFAKGEKPEGRCAHKVVTFEVDESGGERQAQNVVFEPDVVSRRARMRSGGRGIAHEEEREGDEEAAPDHQQAEPRARDRGEAHAQAAGEAGEARSDQERRDRAAGLARTARRGAGSPPRGGARR